MYNLPDEIQNTLMLKRENSYRLFLIPLLPTVEPEKIIGVRASNLKMIARQLKNNPNLVSFTSNLPHTFHEENLLHCYLICQIRNYDECIREVNAFLPFIDNWAVCDSLRPQILKKHTDRLKGEIDRWLASSHPYTVRFAIEMLMLHFLDSEFSTDYIEKVSSITSDDYYVNMMIAWYFATALDKQYDSAIKYIHEERLSPWVHNKAIQKAVESLRISSETQEYLKTLKR